MTPRQANEAAAPGPRGGQNFQPTLFARALLSNVETGRQKRARYLHGDQRVVRFQLSAPSANNITVMVIPASKSSHNNVFHRVLELYAPAFSAVENVSPGEVMVKAHVIDLSYFSLLSVTSLATDDQLTQFYKR